MTSDKYPMYGLVIVAGAAAALWAGLSPSLLIFLVVCPLMMFLMMVFMMRPTPGDHGDHDAQNNGNGPASDELQRPSQTSKATKVDGSHESIPSP